MIRTLLLLLSVTFLIANCQTATQNGTSRSPKTQTMQAVAEKITELDSIPSGSGLVKDGENFYLISDDSPYLFQLDRQFNLLQKVAIRKGQKTRNYRIPKATKPDYESATLGEINGKKYLLVFASGSKSPERDSLLVADLHQLQRPQTYSLKPLYNLIKKQSKLPDAELNVEGSAIIGQNLYLFNRGQNLLVQTSWPQTLAFLTQKPAGPAPEIKTYRIVLPQIQGIDPGFSGACQLGTENKLLFTASVENTPNWIEDGEILGSFIGILNVEKLNSEPLEAAALLTGKNGKPIIEKLESIEFLHREANGAIKALCLTDDDLGGSKLLEISLKL